MKLYKSLVRLYVEYCTLVWPSCYQKDKLLICMASVNVRIRCVFQYVWIVCRLCRATCHGRSPMPMERVTAASLNWRASGTRRSLRTSLGSSEPQPATSTTSNETRSQVFFTESKPSMCIKVWIWIVLVMYLTLTTVAAPLAKLKPPTIPNKHGRQDCGCWLEQNDVRMTSPDRQRAAMFVGGRSASQSTASNASALMNERKKSREYFI